MIFYESNVLDPTSAFKEVYRVLASKMLMEEDNAWNYFVL